MDMDMANATLQNILAACDQAPNTIPFDKLVLRQKLNTGVYNRLLMITAVILILTFLSPLTVVPVAEMLAKNDSSTPVLLDNYVKEDMLYLELSGEHIIFTEAYLETADGKQYFALSYDASHNIICFPYFGESESNIYIPVENQSTLHFLVTPESP